MMNVTTAEQMVWVMAGYLADAEVIQLGLSSPLNQVAALLAHHLADGRGPAIEDPAALTLTRALRMAHFARGELAAQCGATRSFEAPEWIVQMMPRLSGRVRQFVRPLQIDVRGRINTLQVRTRDGGWRRFAGLAGLAELADICQPFLCYLPRQDRRAFVEQVDFIVSDPLAHHAGGQVILVTDLATFVMTREGARLAARHPGVSDQALADATPPAVDLGSNAHTPAIPAEALACLRERVDPLGVRNLEFLSGAERHAAILGLAERERTLTLD
ncbi:MAG: hypothetical protein IOMNBAOH_02526 [Rhodocyclaceae bacterium]|nr:hypothetical protein [Rhodocyclaceae bacterium]